MSPLEGQVHHIDYMSYICHACTKLKIGSPIQGLLHWNEKMDNKRWIIKKGVRERLIFKRKLRASKVK
jgi:hypothetical protein